MSSKTEFLGYLPAGTQLFEYRIERVLGHGGFGITYLAQDTLLDKPVAIKEYLPTDLAMRTGQPSVVLRSPDMREAFIWGREQFLKEARTLARFSHPNLITVHRFFESNDTAYFVMEYAQGQTLAQILKRDGAIAEERLKGVVLPILSGLEQVHKAGVLHRDIKPDNIMLRADGTPVLIDFGAARVTLGSKTRSILSVLTAGYAPLEQYGSSGSNQGPWTDIYALGAVMYRALTGKKPADAVNRVHSDPMVPAAIAGFGKFTPHFLAAIDWGLAVVPDHRPRSIEDWRPALEGIKSAPVTREVAEATAEAAAAAAAGVESTTVTRRRNTWEQIADDAAQQYAEFSGQIPESHADSPSAPERLRSTSTSLTMMPDAAPSQRTTWIAAAVMFLLVVGTFEFVIHSDLRGRPAPAPAVATATPPPPAPASEINATPKLDTRFSPPPEPAKPVTAAPVSVTPIPAPASAEKPASATLPAVTPPVTLAEDPAAKPKKGDKKRSGAIADLKPLSTFKDCDQCPLMTALPAGSFTMGAPMEPSTNAWERPAHPVQIHHAFAIARTEISVAQWRACVAQRACSGDGVGRDGVLPAINVSWQDTQKYLGWLSKLTGRSYRLPSEAEWEYAARAGNAGSRYWGEERTQQCEFANGADQSGRSSLDKGLRVAECDDHFTRLAPVGTFKPNDFGLLDMSGNVWEWVQDCWHDNYEGAPRDGSAADTSGCATRVIRGGSWRAKPEALRSFSRGLSTPDHRGDDLGFRVATE